MQVSYSYDGPSKWSQHSSGNEVGDNTHDKDKVKLVEVKSIVVML